MSPEDGGGQDAHIDSIYRFCVEESKYLSFYYCHSQAPTVFIVPSCPHVYTRWGVRVLPDRFIGHTYVLGRST